MLQLPWGGHGSLTLSPPESSGLQHPNVQVMKTSRLVAPQLHVHGDGYAEGTTAGDPRSLFAWRYRWRCWLGPSLSRPGCWWRLQGTLGTPSNITIGGLLQHTADHLQLWGPPKVPCCFLYAKGTGCLSC